MATGKHRTLPPAQIIHNVCCQRKLEALESTVHNHETKARTRYRKLYLDYLHDRKDTKSPLEHESMLRVMLLTLELSDVRRKLIRRLDELLKLSCFDGVDTYLPEGEDGINIQQIVTALRACESMSFNEISCEQKIKGYISKQHRTEKSAAYRKVVEKRRANIYLIAKKQKESDLFDDEGCPWQDTETLVECAQSSLAYERSRKRKGEAQDNRKVKRQNWNNHYKNGYNKQSRGGKGGNRGGKGRGRGRGRGGRGPQQQTQHNNQSQNGNNNNNAAGES